MRTSNRVTWHSCPRCGGLAAVGWAPVPACGAAPTREHPVEFDCTVGCPVGVEEVRTRLRPRRGPASPG